MPALKKIADLVFKTPGGGFRTVGALLQFENADQKKGPGYQIALDRHFNPAGCIDDGTGTVWLGTYFGKEQQASPRNDLNKPTSERKPPADFDENDIPF